MEGYRIVIPIFKNQRSEQWIHLARHLLPEEGGHIDLIGIVEILGGHSLSEGALEAQECREELVALVDRCADLPVRISPNVWVSHAPWLDLLSDLQETPADLLLVPWEKPSQNILGVPVEELLAHAPCDVILVQGAIHRYDRVLIPVRGTPHLQLKLRLAHALTQLTGEEVTILHVQNGEDEDPIPMLRELKGKVPFHMEITTASGNPADVVTEAAAEYHAIVLGASLSERLGEPALGGIHTAIIAHSPIPVFLVRSFREAEEHFEKIIPVLRTISLSSPVSSKVDRWFATNTFHWSEFEDVEKLMRWKALSGQTISLALPALNEENTVGRVIETVRNALMEEYPLLDEIVLIDSNSTDRTREIAESLGVPVYIHQEILADEVGSGDGKGEALWKSLYVTRGDIVAWIDTDIVNIHPRFVLGIVGPLLRWERIQYVKGFYRRPLREGERVRAGGGGRVTELVARPFINLFFPDLSGIIQPLSGEYAGRRSLLEELPFFSGYGVETGLLLDILARTGLNSIAQTDLEVRVHHNQPLANLSRMSFAILQVFMSRLGQRSGVDLAGEMHRTMKIVCQEPGRLLLTETEITERERPPIVTLPAYQERFHGKVDRDRKSARAS